MQRMTGSGAHLLPPHLAIAGGRLAIDGCDAVALAEAHGSPLFVYSERRLAGNASGFLAAARSGHSRAAVFFASKACSNLHVLGVMRAAGIGIEVNSGGELWKAFAAGFAPAEIVFNGVAKSTEELREAVGRGIKAINVESAFELQRIAEVAGALGRKAAVSLRLVPGIGGGATAGIQTGSATSKFGMTAPELQAALEIARANARTLDVAGMHLHIGSQVTAAGDYETAVDFAATMRREIGAAVGTPLRLVNLGGGYPVDYAHLADGSNRANDGTMQAFVAEESARAMVSAVASRAARALGSDVEVLFEPGRSLVADAAVLLTRIENTRRRGDMPWLYLDAGYNLMIDAAAVRWYYHMINASRAAEPAATSYRVVGPLCDSADCFFDVEGEYLWKSLAARLSALPAETREQIRAEIVRLPETRDLPAATAPGDVIALLDTGAYTIGEMFQYCGRLRAEVVMVERDGGVRVIRDRDRPNDLLTPAEQAVAVR
jgi:diaminopimelate decarboxylase